MFISLSKSYENLTTIWNKGFENIMGKEENAGIKPPFPAFPIKVCILEKAILIICITITCSFNLDESKILLFGEVITALPGLQKFIEINSVPNDKILDSSNLKAFADDKVNVTEKLKFVWER